jgi:hypothetical protein
MAQSSYQTINLTADTTLSWPFSFTGGPTIADINNVNASVGPFKVILPDATLAAPGQNIIFNNISGNSFNIMYNDGTTLLTSVSAGEIYYLYLTNITTSNGVWVPIPFGGGTSAINSVIAKSTNNTINITGGTLTPPGGTIDFQLPTSISNIISGTNAPGILVAKTASPSILTFVTRDLLGDTNISINNSNGVNGDPVFSLSPSLSDIASIAVGSLQISGDVITTNATNGGIQLSSAGTGKVSINGVQIDTSSNITGANNLTLGGSLTIGGTFISPTSPKVIFTFTDSLLGGITKLSSYNVASITGSGGEYTITFSSAVAATDYGITFGLGGGVGPNVDDDPIITNVVCTNKTTSSVSIKIYDRSGVLAQSVPYGITGVIWRPS